MAEEEKKAGFWATLPGTLTGVAAVMTAAGGLILGLYQYGVLGSKRPATTDSAAKSVMSESSKQSGNSSASTTESAAKQQHGHESTVVITAQDGTVTTVFGDSLKHRQYSRELVLQNGQHISFENIKMLEVVRLYDDHARVQITLLSDKVVEGSLDAGLYPFGFDAQNDVGQFGISVSRLKRIVFQR
jgi:hypothetical protein